MKALRRLSLALCIAAALPAAAEAEVRISGFGQAIAGTTSDKNKPLPSFGYDDSIDFKEESLFAVQISADLNDRVDAVAQIIARGTDDFDAELAWAYAAIDLGNDFNLKAGRQRTAFFRYSDFLDVGYAYPWIRPPFPVYNVSLNALDGLGLTHSAFIGDDWFSVLQVQYGGYEGESRIGDTELENVRGIAWDLEYDGWLSVRASYLIADVSITNPQLEPLFTTLRGNGLGSIADSMDYREDRGVFRGLGVKAERDQWLLIAEYTRVSLDDTIFGLQDNWYVSGAWRFGAWQPSLTFGAREADLESGIYAGLSSASPFYPAVVGVVSSQQLDDTYTSVGLRWDFASNVAFKADWTRYESDIAGRQDSDLLSAGVVFTF